MLHDLLEHCLLNNIQEDATAVLWRDYTRATSCRRSSAKSRRARKAEFARTWNGSGRVVGGLRNETRLPGPAIAAPRGGCSHEINHKPKKRGQLPALVAVRTVCESSALPTNARRRDLVGPPGLEPGTKAL